MCGIAGYKCFGDKRPQKQHITNLLLEIETRGTDATGIAFVDSSQELHVFKAPLTASKFIESKRWKKLDNFPETMIMHTRARTQGHESNNKNNHPIFNKRGMAIIHNGQISNYAHLTKTMKMDAEVDSEVILKLIEDHWWKNIKSLEKLSGTFACAFIWQEKPKELILARYASPLAVAIDKENDILYFASLPSFINAMTEEWYKGFKTSSLLNLNPYEIKSGTCLLINETGVKSIEDIHPHSNNTKCEMCGEYTAYRVWNSKMMVCLACNKELNSFSGENNYNHFSQNNNQQFNPDKKSSSITYITCKGCLELVPDTEISGSFCVDCIKDGRDKYLV